MLFSRSYLDYDQLLLFLLLFVFSQLFTLGAYEYPSLKCTNFITKYYNNNLFYDFFFIYTVFLISNYA